MKALLFSWEANFKKNCCGTRRMEWGEKGNNPNRKTITMTKTYEKRQAEMEMETVPYPELF